MNDRYAVFGNPIAHSKSPLIHTLFAEHAKQNLSYTSQHVEEDGFFLAAQQFFEAGGRGLNITLPFKQIAFEYADITTERATIAGAVNTLLVDKKGNIVGDNTDGIGLANDLLNNLGWQIKAKRLLVLGAGGAVRGILQSLLAHHPQHIVIANRSVDKALSLSKQFAESGYVLGCGLDMLAGQEFDIIINGTSIALSGGNLDLPDTLLLSPNSSCYDLMYGADPSAFLTWAAQRGAQVSDGLGMLVEQAAESFYLWRGVKPSTQGVIDALRRTL